ncbi:MAG TPA: flagellar export chaperone FliS [Telluria sp.]|nr:flagellar export chaperone FliS [Telluria sp.]
MLGSMKSGASAYAKIGVETGVVAASPHKLISMLFEGAIVAIRAASQQMQAGDIEGKGKSISKAIDIIDNGLKASLDVKAGGEIAANLQALYQYMSSRLLEANLKNAPELLDEVKNLLADLAGAWEAIGQPQQAAAAAPAPQVTRSAYDNLAPVSRAYVSAA